MLLIGDQLGGVGADYLYALYRQVRTPFRGLRHRVLRKLRVNRRLSMQSQELLASFPSHPLDFSRF